MSKDMDEFLNVVRPNMDEPEDVKIFRWAQMAMVVFILVVLAVVSLVSMIVEHYWP